MTVGTMFGARILLAEDDGLTLALLAGFLMNHGFEVIQATTAAQLRERTDGTAVDLAILDIRLPDGSGVEAFLHVADGPNTPIICISSDEDEGRAVVAGEPRISDYLLKPVDEEELLVRIGRLLRTRPASEVIPLSADGRIGFDPHLEHLVHPGGSLSLTGAEAHLLACLARKPRVPVSRDDLSEAVLGRRRLAEDRSVDVLIGRLRRKLRQIGAGAQIVAVRNRGYRYEPG